MVVDPRRTPGKQRTVISGSDLTDYMTAGQPSLKGSAQQGLDERTCVRILNRVHAGWADQPLVPANGIARVVPSVLRIAVELGNQVAGLA